MEYCRHQVADDCAVLLGLFQKTESVRFEVFSKIWRDMKFSEIFYGTSGALESRAFSREVLAAAFRYFLPPSTFQIRVGALYLLYALYSHQLAQPRVQIQVALKDWEEVTKFEKMAAEAQHYDAVYVLRKLFSQNAFFFAAMPRHLSYSQRRSEEKPNVCEEFLERSSRPQELVNREMLEELANVHEHYERCGSSLNLVLPNLVQPDLVLKLRQTVMDFSRWHVKTGTAVQSVEDSGEGSSRNESSQRAELISAIKSRSYGQAVQAPKSRRHRQVEITSDVPLRPQKVSLKSRTDDALTTSDSGDMKKETSTKVWRLTAPENMTKDVPRDKKIKFKW